MNKSDLIEALHKETGLTKTKVETVGLCSIRVKEYKAYTGRNPKTKESLCVI